MPSCSAASAKFPSAQSELGRRWNNQNQSLPNSHLKADESPCTVTSCWIKGYIDKMKANFFLDSNLWPYFVIQHFPTHHFIFANSPPFGRSLFRVQHWRRRRLPPVPKVGNNESVDTDFLSPHSSQSTPVDWSRKVIDSSQLTRV